jgi:hypothetical protein
VGATPGTAKLYAGPPENRGSSTMVPELAERYRDLGQDFHAIEVPVRTLAQIVEEHVSGPVDFLKVDVEGYEREVLAGVDWQAFRPRAVVVEATFPERWDDILAGAGYALTLYDGINNFYVSGDDEEAIGDDLRAPATVLDAFDPYLYVSQLRMATDHIHALQARVNELEAAGAVPPPSDGLAGRLTVAIRRLRRR